MSLRRTTHARQIDKPSVVDLVEAAVDGEQAIATPSFIAKLYVRKRLFLACLLVPALVSAVIAALTPQVWVARTEIMVRYGSSESAFLQDLIPADRAMLSGPVIAEMVRSLTTLIETVRRYGIKAEDVYREPSKVAFSRLTRLLPFHHAQPSAEEEADQDTAVARALQSALEESSQAGSNSFTAKSRPIELLGKDSPLPQSQKGDELITVTLRSFNRDKVAAMTNGLAQTVIDTYYQTSAADAHRAYEFLSSLAVKGEATLRRLRDDPDAPADVVGPELLQGAGKRANPSGALTKLQGELASAQAELVRARQFYGSDATRIQRSTAEIETLGRLIARQERIDAVQVAVDDVNARRFQAKNAENLYRDHLVPINIIEPAVTPPSSEISLVGRVLISAVTGLVAGGILGTALVVVFGLIDKRLFTPLDVERSLGLPTIGWLPRLATWRTKSGFLPDISDAAVRQAGAGLLPVALHLDLTPRSGFAKVVALASLSDDEGKSLAALLLAKTMAKPGVCKVLLVDADPFRASLTAALGNVQPLRAVDRTMPMESLADLIVPTETPNLDVLTISAMRGKEHIGPYLSQMRRLFSEAGNVYDLVIVDTPSLSGSPEALMCCTVAHDIVLLARSGVTKSTVVQIMLRKLQELSIRPRGVLLNDRYHILPAFIDRGV